MTERIIIKHPVDLVAHLNSIRSRKQEHFGVAFLDSGLELISKKILFVGGISRTIVDKKVIYWEACKKKANGVILFHNHPSYNLTPTKEDIDLTNDLAKGFDLLGISLLDHIIVSKYGFNSFVESGLLLNLAVITE